MSQGKSQTVTPIVGREALDLSPAQRSSLLQEARDIFVRRMSTAMGGMMDKVDDTLFEMADKSENNALQSLYFDAMREVRIKRPAIETLFKQKLVENFQQMRHLKPAAAGELNLLDPGELELELVEDESLETSIAIQNMEQKIDSNCKQELYALDKRVALLTEQHTDDESFVNPMGASALAHAVDESIKKIDSGVKIRLIVLKLFDKHVLTDLDEAFAQVNLYLMKRNVLPQIRTRVKNQASKGKSRITVSETDDGIEVASEGNLFETLQQLLTVGTLAGAASGVPTGGIGSAAPAGPGAGLLAALPAPTITVVHDLTALQQGSSVALAAQAGIDAGTLSSGTVNVLRDLKMTPVVANMDQANQMTFDIVAMLFDYILDDNDIPDKMKALIGRLQIPLVKVAIIDKEFFAKKAHPARKLLNLLAQAALGWIEEQGEQDPLFRAVNSVVQKILNEFDDDIALFTKLVTRFEQFLNEQERQAKVRADRTAKVIQGRERLQVAKTRAQKEITRRTYKRDISSVVLDFLNGHWRNLLISAYLEGEADCEAWTVGIETMADLIWSVIPKRSARDRQKLNDMLPSLIKRLKQGMERISMDLGERRQFLAALANRHTEVVRTVSQIRPAEPVTEGQQDLTKVVLGRTDSQPEATAQPDAGNVVALPPREPEVPEDQAAPESPAEQQEVAAKDNRLLPPISEDTATDSVDEKPSHPRGSDSASISEAMRQHLNEHPEDAFAGHASEEEFVQEMDEEIFDVDEDPDPYLVPVVEEDETSGKSSIEAIAEHADPEIRRLLESGEFDLEELTLGDDEDDHIEIEATIEDEFTEAARALEKGTWVEFHESDGSTKRARLTWVSSVTSVYLFTDRNGLKAGDRTLNGLAAEFRRGSAKVIEDVPLFDRAVGKLLDGLEKRVANG